MLGLSNNIMKSRIVGMTDNIKETVIFFLVKVDI